MSTKYKVFASIAVMVLIVCIFMVVRTTSLAIPQRANIDLADKTLSVQASLQSYCETELEQNEPTCLPWAQDIVTRRFQAAENCYSAFDWFMTTSEFTNCLQAEGIITTK